MISSVVYVAWFFVRNCCFTILSLVRVSGFIGVYTMDIITLIYSQFIIIVW